MKRLLVLVTLVALSYIRHPGIFCRPGSDQ